jgi:hypothetical protein
VNREYLEKVVTALGNLDWNYRKQYGEAGVDMASEELEPDCGTPGCHAAWLYLAIQSFDEGHPAEFHYEKAAKYFLDRVYGSNWDWPEEVPVWPHAGARFIDLFTHDWAIVGQKQQYEKTPSCLNLIACWEHVLEFSPDL